MRASRSKKPISRRQPSGKRKGAILAGSNRFTDGNTAAGQRKPYRSDYAVMAKKLCEIGATSVELADHFGVSLTTLQFWQASESEFFDACKIVDKSCRERFKRAQYESALQGVSAAAKLWDSKFPIEAPANPIAELFRQILGTGIKPQQLKPKEFWADPEVPENAPVTEFDGDTYMGEEWAEANRRKKYKLD